MAWPRGTTTRRRRCVFAGLAVLGLLIARGAGAQEPAKQARDTTLETGVSAGEADADRPRRRLVKWNEFDLKYLTLRIGAGFLVDYVAFSQDDAAKQQVPVESGAKIRDSRIIVGGRFKTQRRITYQAGLMYDGLTESWFVRQTGIMVAVPEALGHLWVGRAKEGPSLNRVMVGYDGWTMERFTMSDASIPLLADGIKWLGYLPSRKLLWNLGVFTDWLSEGQSFSYYDHQVAGRVMWVPMVSDTVGKLLHIGMSFRLGTPNEDTLQLKSKPEASVATNFIDTGKFPAQKTQHLGFEMYYRPGPWLFGGEYHFLNVDSRQTDNPTFSGGDLFAAYMVTGETRSYNTVGGYFRGISPRKTVFEGGRGAWEVLLRFSYIDLDSGTLRGGKFWRITPMVNWYLSDVVRLEAAYGYGKLDRFNLEGATQFMQTRLQIEF